MAICYQRTPKPKELRYSKPSILSDFHLPQNQRVNLTRNGLGITAPVIDASKKEVLGNLPNLFLGFERELQLPIGDVHYWTHEEITIT